MTKTQFWKKDWFLALIIAAVFLVLSTTPTMQSAENAGYDMGLRSADSTPHKRIAIIAIDDRSLANIGRWPWNRDVHAQMIERLQNAGAKTIGYTAFFFEPQEDAGLGVLRELSSSLDSAQLTRTRALPDGSVRAAPGTAFTDLRRTMRDINEADARVSFKTRLEAIQNPVVDAQQQLKLAISALDADTILSNTIENAGNVVLPMYLQLGNQLGRPDGDLPSSVLANRITTVRDSINAKQNNLLPNPAINIESPIPLLGDKATSIGHLNAIPDVDGGIRTEPLVLSYYDQYYPSLSLQIAANSLNLSTPDITINLGESVTLGQLSITTDNSLQMNTFFYKNIGNLPAFEVDSFSDVLSGKVPTNKYKDKIVLIGATAAGLGTTQVTPINPAMPPLVTLAHSVSSILNEDFFISPPWAYGIKLAAFLLVTVFLMAGLPRLSAPVGAGVSAGLLAVFFGLQMYFMSGMGLWVQLVTPGLMLLTGYVLITTKRFLVSEKGKERSDHESAESNRMLGLAFQGQGQLDMAFEKFRKCPKDEQLAEALYNLALDYERKRQFAKAANAFGYIFSFAPSFKDIADRLDRSKRMEETVILGGNASSTMTMQLDGEKPMLGRYEVNTELGKGAMGVVYKGSDPKISRTVAIKTMALAQEFEGAELQDAKERFFREAETAGRLNHPHIVTIYDAGEEHDLAYIAMEFLQGHDLSSHVSGKHLLKPGKVFEITIKCAVALDYAHGMNVVHRDIKPANIMYHADTNELKITDFGIARITDSSKTKTGTILGTPSYMSPEQLSGKRVDGRSDLFSLAVMFYQMLAGKLPFKADSMAALMYQIANEPFPPIETHNPKLPPALNNFFEIGLAKDPDQRFQSGNEMAKALKQTLAAIKRTTKN